ncbi:MAG: NUDIX hydrolase [Candidatus Eremiobacteraeota bacterium]|nr:NUDIX hydrolase [Candidatus Eremiobacteraeota bacterium]
MRTVGSKVVFEGKVFTVRQDTIEDEGRSHVIDLVEHALSYAVIAQPSASELVLVHQYRHAVQQKMWEIPAGMADEGEKPQDGALRELREETGYRGGRIRKIFGLYPTPGFCTERLDFFLVDHLTTGETSFDDDEQIISQVFSLEEALAMLGSGDIMDCKTAVALLWLDKNSRQQIA